MADNGPVTTARGIAVGNLQARIDGQLSRATGGRLTVSELAELVELIALRGHVLGCIADAELAAALADELVDQVPSDARSLVARARMRGVFHRFASALTDLDTAAALGGDRVDLDAERWFRAATRCYRGTSPFPVAMWSSNAASCGWNSTICAVPAPGAMRRSAGFRPTSPRRATWPNSTLPWGHGGGHRPPSAAGAGI